MSTSSEENPGSEHENVSKVVKTATTKESQLGQKLKPQRRIHKAERERLKREQLNDLFDSLANVLEVSDETNGKASVLNEAAKFVKDMLTQVGSLRRENEVLLLESQYVDMEKRELLDETASLELQIAELQKQLKDRSAEAVPPSPLDLNTPPFDYQRQMEAMQHAVQQAANLKPVYVIPICSEPVFQPPGVAEVATRPATTLSKPQPRYPTPADKWPSQLLEKHLQ